MELLFDVSSFQQSEQASETGTPRLRFDTKDPSDSSTRWAISGDSFQFQGWGQLASTK